MVDPHVRLTAATNLLKIDILGSILDTLEKNRISVIVLKGAMLIECVYPHMGMRPMRDIDLLVPRGKLSQVEYTLRALGYRPLRNAPGAFVRHLQDLPIDIKDHLWFLTENEENDLWKRAKRVKIAERQTLRMEATDILLHTMASSAIHHGELRDEWIKDIGFVIQKWQDEINWETLFHRIIDFNMSIPAQKFFMACHTQGILNRESFVSDLEKAKTNKMIKSLYSLIISRDVPNKGHILKFIFQRNTIFRFRFLKNMLFPSDEFLNRRHLKELTIFSRILRPFRLSLELTLLIIRFFSPPPRGGGPRWGASF